MTNLDFQFEEFMKEPLSTGESPDSSSSSRQEANLNEEHPVRRKFWWVKERPQAEITHTEVASNRTSISEAYGESPQMEGGYATIPPTIGIVNIGEIPVIASPDISSSMAEFLEKEKLCKKLSSGVSEVDSPGLDLVFPGDDVTDEEIGSIMEQLSQLAGSADDSAADKSMEEILKEAVQLVRETSHSFSGLGDHSKLLISPVEEGLAVKGATVNTVLASSAYKETHNKDFITEGKGKDGQVNIIGAHTLSSSPRTVTNKSGSGKAGNSGEQVRSSRLSSAKVTCRKADTGLGMQEISGVKFHDSRQVTRSGTHANVGARIGNGRTNVGSVIDTKFTKHLGSHSGSVSKRKDAPKKEKTVTFEDGLSLFPKSSHYISNKQENIQQTSSNGLQQEESISKGKLVKISEENDYLHVFENATHYQGFEDRLSVRKEKCGDHLTKVSSVSPPLIKLGDIVGTSEAVFQLTDSEMRSGMVAALQESEKSPSQVADHSSMYVPKEIDKGFADSDTTGSTMVDTPHTVGTSFLRKSLSHISEESNALESLTSMKKLKDASTCTGELPARQSNDRCVQVTDSSMAERVASLEKELLQEQNMSLQLKTKLELEKQIHKKELDELKCKHEEEMFTLKKDQYVLNAEITDLKKQQESCVPDERHGNCHIHDYAARERRITLLEAELQEQEQLMLGYQRENNKLCQAMKQLKEELKTKEQSFAAERQRLLSVQQGQEVEQLTERLKDKDEAIVQLQMEVQSLRDKNNILERNAEELKLSTTVSEAEVGKHKHVFTGAEPALKITPGDQEVHHVKQELTKRELELKKISKEFKLTQKEMAAAQAEVTNSKFKIGTLETKVLDLQTLLTKERAQTQALSLQTEEDKRKIQDLNRQVKEMEFILKRNHPNSISALILAANSEGGDLSPRFKYLENRVQQLEQELTKSEMGEQASIREMQDKFQAMKLRYEEHTSDLELQLASAKHQAHMLRQAAEKKAEEQPVQETRASKRVAAPPMVIAVGAPPANALAVREDAHLLATIRGLKQELASKDKELVKIRRDLDESAKTNRRLQKERERQLGVGVAAPRPPAVKGTALDEQLNEISRRSGSKVYDPSRFEPTSPDRQEDVKKLEQENGMLREKMLHLEEDYCSLQEKRLQDLNLLQEQHEVELDRLVSDHMARHSNSRIADLQGQLSTQQIIIGHLKDRLKLLDEYQEETEMLKAERDHLEKSNMDLMKRVSDLQSMQTPEVQRYEVLQKKLSELEHRHKTREQKLQAIVRDLLRHSTKQRALSWEDRNSSSIRERLLNKNRQLCFYRAEMDRILETLREFSRHKKLGSELPTFT